MITAGSGAVEKSGVDLHNPHGVAFAPDGAQIWVADSEQDQVVVLDARSLRAINAIGVGRTPWATAFSADGAYAYVTNINDDTVSVISAAGPRLTATVALPGFQAKNMVATGTTYAQLHHQPGAIALNPGDGTLWVACNSSSSLAVIDPSSNTVTAAFEIGLGDDPVGIAFAAVS